MFDTTRLSQKVKLHAVILLQTSGTYVNNHMRCNTEANRKTRVQAF
jgi:hypothetical protein